MSRPFDRVVMARGRLASALERLRAAVPDRGEEIDEVAAAARVLSEEMARSGWITAARVYGTDPTRASVDWELKRKPPPRVWMDGDIA